MILFMIYHASNAKPIPYPIPVIAAPIIRVSAPDFQIFRPIMAALATPKLNS